MSSQHNEVVEAASAFWRDQADACWKRYPPALRLARQIREPWNVIQRAAILVQGEALHFDLSPGNTPAEPASQGSAIGNNVNAGYLTEAEIRRRERENIFIVLQRTGWKIKGAAGAAELLGIRPTTLMSRIEKLGLRRPSLAERKIVSPRISDARSIKRLRS
jgi:hypothetical protein